MISLTKTLKEFYDQDTVDGEAAPVLLYTRPPYLPSTSGNPSYIFHHAKSEAETLSGHIRELPIRTQPISLIAGPMTIVDLYINDIAHGKLQHKAHEEDFYKTLQIIPAEQRPNISFYQSLTAALDAVKPATVLSRFPLSEPYPNCFIGAKTQYKLLSKRALALSGLPVAKTEIVDINMCNIPNSEAHSRCVAFTTEVLECATCSDWIASELHRLLGMLFSRPLPFVVKTQQGMGGFGTWVCKSFEEKERAIKMLKKYLRTGLPKLIALPDWAALHPMSLIISEVLPGETDAISFFSHKYGSVEYVSCVSQSFDEEGHLAGGRIIYANEAAHEARSEALLSQLGKYLASKGYYGPAGIDALTDHDGTLRIVDLNPRFPASFPLGVMRPHFDKRGFGVAQMVGPATFGCTRQELLDAFAEETKTGRLITLAWHEGHDECKSMGSLVVAGEGIEEVEELVKKIMKFKD